MLNNDCQLVHISGHGTDAGLVLENELGEPYTVPPQALADLLSTYSPPLECVIINACYSASQGQLISLGVPFTIAMDGPINDDASIEFSRGFYDALGAGRSIDFAYEEGRRTVSLAAPSAQFASQILSKISEISIGGARIREKNRLSSFAVPARSFQSPMPSGFAHGRSPEVFWANRRLELDLLTRYWKDEQVRVVGLIGLGGVGKSTLARRWYSEFSDRGIEPSGFFWWSFYNQPSLDEFLEAALTYLTSGQFHTSTVTSPWVKIQRLVALLTTGRFFIVLDGLEVMQKIENTLNKSTEVIGIRGRRQISVSLTPRK